MSESKICSEEQETWIEPAADFYPYRAEEAPSRQTPWDRLQAAAAVICRRAVHAPERLYPEERELLPLLRELATLYHWYDSLKDIELLSPLPLLRELAESRGFPELLPQLTELEQQTGPRMHRRIAGKTVLLLNRVRYLPLWRELWNRVTASQTGYPHAAEQCCTAWEREQARRKIGRICGERDFRYQNGVWTKIRRTPNFYLSESYGAPYITAPLRREQITVYCEELADEQGLTVRLHLCTDIGKTGGEPMRAAFDCGGRSFYETVTLRFSQQESGTDSEDRLRAALKRAEFCPLTRAERKKYGSTKDPGVLCLLCYLFIAGLAAGIAAMLLVLAAEPAVLLVTGNLSDLKAVFTATPWGSIRRYAEIAGILLVLLRMLLVRGRRT